jgi:hypothetical protein
MTCRVWQLLLQQHLDRSGDGDLEQHLKVCPECASMRPALTRLLRGVALLSPPVPPADLADRIAARLGNEARASRRRRLRRFAPWAALAAAAVLLVVLLATRRPVPEPVKEGPSPTEITQPTPTQPAAPLRDSVAEAGAAVASLTSRTATKTIDQTASLLPLLPAPTMEGLSDGPTIEPMEPLREASSGVSAGFAPVTDSARRAVSLFFRDLPMGRKTSPPAS